MHAVMVGQALCLTTGRHCDADSGTDQCDAGALVLDGEASVRTDMAVRCVPHTRPRSMTRARPGGRCGETVHAVPRTALRSHTARIRRGMATATGALTTSGKHV